MYRINKGLTQEQLAKKIFVTKQAISKWETGKGYPDASILPSIAEILDISIDQLMGTSKIGKTKSKNKAIGIVMMSTVLLVMIIIISIPIVNNYNNAKSIKEIEEYIDFGIPKYGDIVSANFEEWDVYGNSIPISKMSYIIFDKDDSLLEFEDVLSTDGEWIDDVPSDIMILIPNELKGYLDLGDKFRLLNVSLSTLNELPPIEGIYEFILLVYQEDYQRLLIFEYLLIYGG